MLRLAMLLAVLGAAFLNACATSPVSYQEASPVDESNLLQGFSSYSKPSADTLRVAIIRDSGLLGAAGKAKLSVNGVPVALLWSSQRLELNMRPGSYIFAVEPTPRLMGAVVEKEIQVASDRPRAFRIALDGSGAFSIQPSTQLQLPEH